ncbi:MAG: uracil phosphoribosyltransferase [Succinivibrio sp.]|nr:uracil phosphoribosyltransferase [Succinivibrio sp.]
MADLSAEFSSRVHLIEHPLLAHKITKLRDINTDFGQFNARVGEIAMIEAYEALRDLHTELVEIQTPLERSAQPLLKGESPAVVAILRAGLAMAEGVRRLLPEAVVGHIGMYRDPITHLPQRYYCKLPPRISERTIIVTDPMLATGGSAADTITEVKDLGGRDIRFLCIVAAPEGVRKLQEAHPDVEIYIGALDRELNEHKYILPGLGDAGDRIFGTL